MKYNLAILGAAFMIFLSGCDEDNDTDSKETTLQSAIDNYATLVYASYTDTHADALELQTAIEKFVDAPGTETQKAAKQAWLAARETYGQTEAFRFYGGPIDDENGPEGQLNAWPLDESHIDYVDSQLGSNGGEASAGTNIINNISDFPEITKDIIAAQNENGGESNVSSGYHAIEFLLWGQDVSVGAGGGERSYTDYTDAENADRRATYLKEVTQLLVDDLAYLVNEWKVDGTYRTQFTSQEYAQTALENIISALGKLSKGELAGERMYAAYDAQSKEDEHSCFSDNTHRDIVTNALGIQNVFEGTYESVHGENISGVSFKSVLALENTELANQISENLQESVDLCLKIQAPFDQEFLNTEGRVRILAAINSLQDQGDLLAEAAKTLGFSFDPTDI